MWGADITRCPAQAEHEAVASKLDGTQGRMQALQEQRRQLQADLDTHAALKLSAEQAKQVQLCRAFPP
jgi:hypothetical protein